MKPAVILYKPILEDLHQRPDKHFSVTVLGGLTDDNIQQHAQTMANAVYLIGADGKLDNVLLDRMPVLKTASTISVGYDNFDVQVLSVRWVVKSAERVKAGEWRRCIDENWYSVNVHHKTLVVVGMGRIGIALGPYAPVSIWMCLLCATPTPQGGKALRRPLLRSRYLAGAIEFRLPNSTIDGTDVPLNRCQQTGENEALHQPYECGPRRCDGGSDADYDTGKPPSSRRLT